jgi:hypothetical protein
VAIGEPPYSQKGTYMEHENGIPGQALPPKRKLGCAKRKADER